MGENKTIKIMGKIIDYGKLSDEKLIQLYKELDYREKLIDKKIKMYKEQLGN